MKKTNQPMESFKPPAERQNPVFFKTAQDFSLAKTYRRLLIRIHNSEAEPLERACYGAGEQWLAEMAGAYDWQMLDLAYELAYYKRHLRSRNRRQRMEAEEFLSSQAEVLAEVDSEFGGLFERHERLQDELDDLLEQHAREMYPVQIAAQGPLAAVAYRLLRDLRFIFPSQPPGR